MRSNLQEAFVIHSKPYKETSLLVTFFSNEDGKLSAIAKGAKRAKSKFSGNLEPFQLLQINFSGRSNLKTLISADPLNVYQDFATNKNLYSAFYINELINSISVAHIDVDTYLSAKESFEYISERLISGGVVILDDYGGWFTDGVTKFGNELKEDKNYFVIPNHLGQLIIFKI